MKSLSNLTALKRLRKTMLYARMRQHLPMSPATYTDDRTLLEDAEEVRIAWPGEVPKPRIGLVRDVGTFPFWTKYRRFLETNGFPYDIYDIHAYDWIEKARAFDIVAGLVSNEVNHLEEIRIKYHVLETRLGKTCYPSASQAIMYENRCLEAYLSDVYGLPFAKTFISHNGEDALAMLANVRYPLVSKVNYSSGSMGVELVRTPRAARRVIGQAFSGNGRSVHVPWVRQKNYVYFQEFVPNDGYDIRVVLIGNRAFGYFRKVLAGDFRASGMGAVEKRALPEEAIRVAWNAYRHIGGPQLVVDMVHSLNGHYVIIEFSPFFQVESPEQLIVDGVPGAYVIESDGSIRFEKCRFWVHELALRKFIEDEYLPRVTVAS